MSWNRLGAVAPQDLKQARLNLHYAAQVVSGIGRTLLPAQQDDSHTNLFWMDKHGTLAGHAVMGPRPFRAALDFERFRLLFLDLDDKILYETALAGKTLAQAYSWLADAIGSRLGQDRPEIQPLHYSMPEHALGGAGAFSFEPAGPFAELRRWYANAAATLEQVRQLHDSSPVRCWPHHFDIATLISAGPGATIGVGLSPGDDSYDEPYWYVGPWPHPSPDEWPTLRGGGRWHSAGFVAAVLPASAFTPENNQPRRLDEFLTSAIEASQELLAAPATT